MSDTNDVLEAFEQYAGQPEAMIHWDDDSNQYLPNTSLEGDGHQLHSMAKRAAYFFTQRLEDFAGGYRWQSQNAQGEPFAYCHLDVNGKAKELCSAPCADDDPRDTRTVQALYKHPSAPAAVPDGWKLVPTEPTPDMTLHGALSGVSHAGGKFSQKGAEEVYKAMLAAFPQPAENDNQ